ncbi:MAG TPA: Ig-like domain repeat protein [Humisphaera sp.]|jgi:hypothetical protein|nr:Ig-like domain repeat protein [Humisphaera sp.]
MRASRNHRNVRTATSALGASKSIRRRELAESTQWACASVIEKLENRTLLSGTPGTPGYDPNSPGAPAVGAPVAQQQLTCTDLEASTDTPVSGQTIVFTATVTLADPSQNTPLGGSLTVVVDNDTYGVYSLDSTGIVTINLSTLLVGDHEVDAFYSGDSLTTSSSAFYGITVGVANTTTNLVSSQNPAAVGQAVTFTATVTPVAPGGGVPTGSVQFMDGSTSLGIFALNGSGQASFTTSALSIGSHSITASYVGDGNYNASASAALSQSVANASTVTTLLSSGNTVRGQSVTFTAYVSNSGSPTGAVQFMEGANLLGSGTLSGGVATFITSALSVGPHNVTAVYGGDATDNGSTSSALPEVVSKDATNTSLASSVNPSSFGSSVTFTATVSVLAPGAGALGGSVMFMDGTTTLGSGTLSGGVATFSTGSLSVGTHSITAVYGADANDNGSTSSALSQVVNPVAVTSTTTLATSINPALVSTMVTFTATVHLSSGNATGNVIFKDGTTMLGSGAVNANGVATFSTTGLAAGHHTITALYGGDTSSRSASAPLDQTVTTPTPVATKSKVSGVVFCDDNIDGKLETTEKLLAGAVVKLLDGSNHVLATTTSAADGSYSFSDVVAGNYLIYVTSPANGYLAGPNGSTSHLTVAAGVNSSGNNFAEVHVGSLSGMVWSDKNNNGKVDSNEQRLADITIKLSGTDCFGHSISLSTTTNKNGEYSFANLIPGSYTIAEVQPTRNSFATGKAYVGTLGGTASDANTITSVKLLGGGEAGANYNFSELEKSVLNTIANVIKKELKKLAHKK